MFPTVSAGKSFSGGTGQAGFFPDSLLSVRIALDRVTLGGQGEIIKTSVSTEGLGWSLTSFNGSEVGDLDTI